MPWLIAALLVLFAPAALACECQDISAGDAFDRADIVFYGEYDGEEFKVLKKYKGKLKKKVSLDEPRDKCDVGNFETDKRYLVFVETKKKSKFASVCMGTRALEFEPISPVMMTLSDQPQYGVKKKDRDAHQKLRDKMVDEATELLQKAAERCEPDVWKGKEAASGHIEVRFDHTEGRLFTAEILRYQTNIETTDKVRECLQGQLTERKFPKFDGGPFSIQAYYVVDRVDASMVRKKKSGSVVPFKSNDRPTDLEVID